MDAQDSYTEDSLDDPTSPDTIDGQCDEYSSTIGELDDGSIVEIISTDCDPDPEITAITDPTGMTTITEETGEGLTVAVFDPAGELIAEGLDTSGNGTFEPEEIWVAEPAVEQVTPEPEVDQVTPEPEVDQVTPESEVDQVTPEPEVDQVTPEPEPGPFEPVDPTSVVVDPTADTVIGDPGEDAQYWLYQGEFGTCAPTSVAMVLADVLDVPIGSNEDVVQRAVDLGLGGWEQQDDDGVDFSGLYVEDTMALLESYGVDATQSYGDLDTLTAHLEAGSAVMVGVDSSEVNENVDDDDVADTGWNEQSEWNPRGDFDHLLVVTGIDPVNEVVYLNNSNNPDGAGMVIPLDQFMGAWEDSGNAMISTELPDETAATGISDNDIAELTDPAAYEYLPAPDVAQGDDLVEQENTVGLPAVDQPAGEGVLADSSGATSSLAPLVFLPFAFVLRAVSRLR